jgi:hypothetical protein
VGSSNASPSDASKAPSVSAFVEGGLGKAVSWTIDHGKAALVLGGLVVYAIARVAHDAFYARLQVTPDEVGLSQATIAARAELYAFVGIAIIVAAGAAWVAISLAVTEMAGRQRAKRTGKHRTEHASNVRILVSICLFVLAIPLLLHVTEPDFLNFLGRHVVLFAWVIASLFLIFAVAAWREHGNDARAGDGSGRAKLVLMLAILASAVTPTYLLAEHRGEELGSDAASGNQIRGQQFALLSIHADPVCLTTSDPALLRLPRGLGPYLYLGTAGSTVVLYEYEARDRIHPASTPEPLRLPAQTVSTVALDLSPPLEDRACPQQLAAAAQARRSG